MTATPLPSSTPLIVYGVMTGNVWVRPRPETLQKTTIVAVLINTRVQILAVYGQWVKILWQDDFGAHEGWVPRRWVGNIDSIPPQLEPPPSPPAALTGLHRRCVTVSIPCGWVHPEKNQRYVL